MTSRSLRAFAAGMAVVLGFASPAPAAYPERLVIKKAGVVGQ